MNKSRLNRIAKIIQTFDIERMSRKIPKPKGEENFLSSIFSPTHRFRWFNTLLKCFPMFLRYKIAPTVDVGVGTSSAVGNIWVCVIAFSTPGTAWQSIRKIFLHFDKLFDIDLYERRKTHSSAKKNIFGISAILIFLAQSGTRRGTFINKFMWPCARR